MGVETRKKYKFTVQKFWIRFFMPPPGSDLREGSTTNAKMTVKIYYSLTIMRSELTILQKCRRNAVHPCLVFGVSLPILCTGMREGNSNQLIVKQVALILFN